MNTKEVFLLAMAAIGGYAAYLQIKKGQSQPYMVSGVHTGMFNDAFTSNRFDFYNPSYNWLEGADPNKWYGV